MRIALFIGNQKGLLSLKSLPKIYYASIIYIEVAYDKNVLNDYADEIITFCQENNLPISTECNFKPEFDYAIAIGWRQIITTTPLQKLFVFHDSILPRYRGFNPLVTALINGDKEIGVSVILGEENYDTGDIIQTEKISVTYPIKIIDAIQLVSELYIVLMSSLFNKLSTNNLQFTKQDNLKASYSLWRDDEDYWIDWTWSSEKIQRFVNAVGFPYQGAKFRIKNSVYKLIDCSIVPDVFVENRTCGKVLFKENFKIVVVCGSGLLRLDEIRNLNNETILFDKKFRLRLL